MQQTSTTSPGALVGEAARSSFDLALAPGSVADEMVGAGGIAPIDPDEVEGAGDILATLRGAKVATLDGVRYGLPFLWGPTVLIWDDRVLTQPPRSLASLFDPANAGRIAVPDSPFGIADAAIVQGAADPYSLDEDGLDAAEALLRKQNALVREYWTTPQDLALLFRERSVVLAAGRQATARALLGEGATIQARVPDGSLTAWLDVWLESSSARHPRCAAQFLAFATRPDVQAQAATALGASPANGQACALFASGDCATLGTPDAEILPRARFARTPLTPTGIDLWREVWSRAKA